MLGKLIKYEFKATSRLLTPLLICMLALGIIGGAVAALQTRLIEKEYPGVFDRFFEETDNLFNFFTNPDSFIPDQEYSDNYEYPYDKEYGFDAEPGFTAARTLQPEEKTEWRMILVSVTFSLLLLLAGGLACGPVICLILLGYRYYKNMFTDEGYLTFTLPVTPTQNLWAKLITGTVWQILIGGVMILSLSMFFIFGVGTNPFVNIGNLSGIIGQILRLFISLPVDQTGGLWILFSESLFSVILGIPAGLLMVYFAVTLGCQIAQKHKIVASIGLYFALTIARTIISYILQIAVTIPTVAASEHISETLAYSLTGIPNILISLITIAVCFLVSRNIIKNHLNLE